MSGRNKNACEKCRRPSCVHPQICPNLNTDHSKLLDIYRSVDALPGIKHSYIGSGVRYDLLLHRSKDEASNKAAMEYTRELICHHVSGRLKVAPEHTSDRVLYLMRKPSFSQFYDFKRIFDRINREEGLRQQIIPYFIGIQATTHIRSNQYSALRLRKRSLPRGSSSSGTSLRSEEALSRVCAV